MPKKDFHYEEWSDSYVCPQGQRLTPVKACKGSATEPPYTRYATTACRDCLLKERCTTGKYGRQIKRYVGDELKEAMHQVMDQPAVRERFRQRKAMVEPVFSQMRMKQGLNRFRRRGVAAVRVEFALHAMAYNISRVVAYILLFFYMCYLNKYIKHRVITR